MSKKLGVSEEHDQKKNDGQKSAQKFQRVDVDLDGARANVANIINENRKRLDDFDDHDREEIDVDELDDEQFKHESQFNKKVQKPDMFKGDLKSYQLKGLQWLDNLYD